MSDKGGIHQISLLCLQFCLIFHVFICLKRILESLFPSSSPHRSELSIHSIQSIKTISFLAPFITLKKLGLIPEPKTTFPFDSSKTPKIKINILYLYTQPKISLYFKSYRASLIIFAEIDLERALSCSGRASYQTERGLMLP